MVCVRCVLYVEIFNFKVFKQTLDEENLQEVCHFYVCVHDDLQQSYIEKSLE